MGIVIAPAGLITPSRFVDIVSTATAQAFGIYPRKGVIAPGSDADVIIFDTAVEHTISAASHHSRMDTNIYEGKRIKGKVSLVLTNMPSFSGPYKAHSVQSNV
jgi:dihydropyrimidinase